MKKLFIKIIYYFANKFISSTWHRIEIRGKLSIDDKIVFNTKNTIQIFYCKSLFTEDLIKGLPKIKTNLL